MDKAHERRFELLGFAVLFTVWGGAGLLTGKGGYTDALYEPDYTIQYAPEGGVLARAGFQVGDTVVAVEGIPVTELGMYSRWPRALARRPGEPLRMTVRRAGQQVEGVVVAQERPASVVVTRWASTIFFQAFLWLGLWALFTTPGRHAGRMALLGLVGALAIPGPSLGSLDGLRDHLQLAAEMLFLALLLHFLLLFPRAKRPARSPWIGLIYLPWVGLLGCLLVELAAHPRLYHAFGGYVGVLILGYLLGSLAALVHSAVTFRGEARRGSGVSLLLAGWILGVLPSLAAVLGWFIPPGWDMPGQRWFPFLLVLIPAGTALAVRREARGA